MKQEKNRKKKPWGHHREPVNPAGAARGKLGHQFLKDSNYTWGNLGGTPVNP